MADAIAATPAPVAGAQTTEAKAAPADTVDGKTHSETAKTDAAIKKEWKLKAKNREVVVDSEEKLLHYANKAFGAEQAFEEAKRMRAEIEPQERLLRALNSDDIEAQEQALAHIVGSPEKLEALVMKQARAMYEKQQKLAGMPEDQRKMLSEKEQLKAELDSYREQQRAYQEQQQQLQEQQELHEARNMLATIAQGVLEDMKFSDESRPMVLRGLVPYVQAALEAGIDVNPKALAAEYLNDTRDQFKTLTMDLDGESLVSWLGPDVVKKLNKYALSQLHGGAKPTQAATTEQPKTAKQEENDGTRYLREKFGFSIG